MTHVLLEYTLAPDYLERRGEYRAAHLALLEPAAAAGDLLLGGALGESVEPRGPLSARSSQIQPARPFDRSLFVWRDGCEAAAAAFATADPYVTHGLVESWRLRVWNTAVGSAMES